MKRLKKSQMAFSGAAVLFAAIGAAGGAMADQVIPDNLIIQGSACVGVDCVNGEPFGFDTQILKENNLRILFLDTSTSPGFPTNDWRLIANDSASGGSNFFAIEDATAARQVFRVDAGAPADALRVSSTGNVGIGTATPVLDVSIRTGDTPATRLEQDGSLGYQAQTWDIGGNEANFFIRDVTGGSRLPIRLRPGAPTSSIDIAATGRVGFGTATPLAPLHVVTTASSVGVGNAGAILANPSGPVALQLIPSSGSSSDFWNVSAASATEFRIARSGVATPAFSLTQAGALTIPGSITTGGPTCSGGCDRVFDAGYDVPSIDAHAGMMWGEGYLPNVGPTPEGAPIDLSDKLGRMLSELEYAHIYIAQLNARVETLEAELRERNK